MTGRFRRRGPAGSPDVGVVTGTAGFAALESEWDDLHRHTSGAFPHESWAFLYSWWESHGAGRGLRLVTLRSPADGLLVGLAPFMIERRHRFRTLVFLVGHEPLDVLARDGWGPAVEAALVRALPRVPGWDVAELRPVRPGALIERVYRRWRGPGEHAVLDHFPFVAAGTEDEVFASISKKQRSTVRQALRRAAEDGLECRRAPAAAAALAGSRLVELHRELWEGREISPSHATAEFERFLTAAAARLVPRGLADVVEWTRDGRVEISVLFLHGPAAVHVYQVGASRYAVDRLQWSSLFVREGIALARERGVAALDLAPGDEQYKARWSPRPVPHQRLRFGRGLRGRAFFALRRVRTRAGALRARVRRPGDRPGT